MKYNELQHEVAKYVYSEDAGMARIALASIIATKLKLGDPVWMLLIGPSSGGKSQVLRPLSLTDKKFLHRVDDLTENTLLSGAAVAGGGDISLLNTIGKLGMIVVSDFTVIFSKSSEARASILGQLRMVYDGEMTKYSGNKNKPIKWEGYLGMLAGSTPSIYSHFEEVADMGERFIYYRMKSYDVEKATRIALSRTVYGRELDEILSGIYSEYIQECIDNVGDIPHISNETYERIISISMFAANLRTPTHYDKYARTVDKIPVPEMPMRVASQLRTIARGLSVMSYYDTGSWELSESDMQYIEWCAYSLANEERRACLREIAQFQYGVHCKTQNIADKIGLDTSIVQMNLQHLSAIGIVIRSGTTGSLSWGIKEKSVWEHVRKLEGFNTIKDEEVERELSSEEMLANETLRDLNF